MNSSSSSQRLPEQIATSLGDDDDPLFWVEALRVAAEDASELIYEVSRHELYAVVGSCSHWVRPHQSRWTADGGFALPWGYGDGEGVFRGIPNLDWSVTLQFDCDLSGWIIPEQVPTKGFRSVRLAIPARTKRHQQAAVNAIWSPKTLDVRHKRTVFYGFRNSEQGWKLSARKEEGEALSEQRH